MTSQIYATVNHLLASGEKLVLARIIHRTGSAPRDVGSMCVVTKKEIYGSVGGGSIEYQMVQSARRLLDTGESSVYQFRMNNEDVAGSGMICGGDVDLFLEPVFPSNKAKFTLYQALARRIEDQAQGILVTKIGNRIPADRQGTSLLAMPDQETVGTIDGLPPQYLNYAELDAIHQSPFGLVSSTGPQPDLFIERIDTIQRVILFGAGHISEYVSKLAKMVGFHVTVIDDRAEFANSERFSGADSIIAREFETVFDSLNITSASYVLILTRGHLYDAHVLEKSLGTDARYIGMIGSRRKRDMIYRSMLEKGFAKSDLERVSSPVGVAINAQTPEEIAVSIVAELIQKRAPEKPVRLA